VAAWIGDNAGGWFCTRVAAGLQATRSCIESDSRVDKLVFKLPISFQMRTSVDSFFDNSDINCIIVLVV
jgi:hypothetical protein